MTAARKSWSDPERAILRARYPHEPTSDIARDLGCTASQVYAQAHHLNLKKTDAYLSSPAAHRLDGIKGMGTRFEKGSVPANKGLRRPGYSPGRMAETQFKKGRPASEARNYLPISSERLSKDGYLERKVTDDPALVPARRWVPVHVLLWIEHHGPVPAKHIITFKNGDKTDIRIDNLECLSQRDNMKRNSLHNYGPEIASLIQLRGAINRQLNNLTKGQP